MDEDLSDYGPRMLALNELQRRYVLAVVDNPSITHWKAAEAAGYGVGGEASTDQKRRDNQRAIGSRLAKNPRVIAAMHEEMGKRLQIGGMIGIMGLIALAKQPAHKFHVRACEALADRAGFVAVQRHEVKVQEVAPSREAMEVRVRELCGMLGIDPGRLLGGPKVIEGEAQEAG